MLNTRETEFLIAASCFIHMNRASAASAFCNQNRFAKILPYKKFLLYLPGNLEKLKLKVVHCY